MIQAMKSGALKQKGNAKIIRVRQDRSKMNQIYRLAK